MDGSESHNRFRGTAENAKTKLCLRWEAGNCRYGTPYPSPDLPHPEARCWHGRQPPSGGYSAIEAHHALVMVSEALARRRSGCQSGGSFYGINRHAAARTPRSHVPTAFGATPGNARPPDLYPDASITRHFSPSPQVRRALQLRARGARAEAAAAAVGHEPGRLQPRRWTLHGRRQPARGRVLHR